MVENSPAEIAQLLKRISAAYDTTPLRPLPLIAQDLGIRALFAKDESCRFLGSFKSLGGTYAALRAIARGCGYGIETLLDHNLNHSLPDLITASAGNHGLAVAAAARLVGARARVFVCPQVSEARRQRVKNMGAEIVVIDGTYDDSVEAAMRAARCGEGLLVADTSDKPIDPIVADVMSGYGVIPFEIKKQTSFDQRATHVFVQAGVGGLAAAVTAGLKDWLEKPARIVIVEPTRAACVQGAVHNGAITRLSGELDTVATMLACGEASRPAIRLLAGLVDFLTVDEDELLKAPTLLRQHNGPVTTPSGAAGVAAVRKACLDGRLREKFCLHGNSRILTIITEGGQVGVNSP